MEILSRVFILVVSIVVFFRNIDRFPLSNWDEAWYAEITRNMASGEYSFLVPFWNGEYYFDKPPLYFWLSLPFFRIFGPGEWQTRIISALASVLATFLVYLIAKRMFTRRIAIMSAIVFLTLGQVVVRFAHGNLDALAVCLILATVYFYLVFPKFWFIRRKALLIPGIILALTYLAKGWILGLVPIVAAFLFERLTLSGNHKQSFSANKKIISLVTFSMLAASPYYVLGYLTFGQEFVRWYLFNPTASSFSFGSFSGQFFGNLIRDVGFWFVPVGLGLVMAAKVAGEYKTNLFVLFGTSLVFLLGISFLRSKLGWYALPAYPFVAILIAYFVDRIFKKGFALVLLLLAVTVALQVYNVNRIENLHPDRSQVGAILGKKAAEIVPAEDMLILDDRDLPAFLFYSEHKKVFVVSEGNAWDWEWWIFKYEDLPELAATGTGAWVVTRNSDLVSNADEVAEVEGYKFLRINEI